jgi:uncharacterized protein YecT (DUF1311 family)
LRQVKAFRVLLPVVLLFAPIGIVLPRASNGAQFGVAAAQEAPSMKAMPYQQEATPRPQEPSTQQPQNLPPQQPHVAQTPIAQYDKALFQKPFSAAQLAFLHQFDGAPADTLYGDKEFHKLMHGFVPDCMFHYGRDMPLSDALDIVFKGSRLPVRIRDGRYLTLAGSNGPYLSGRGFLWIDLQDGIALGGFFFHPTNGEPTPSVNIFSRQVVKEDWLAVSQLPPAFIEDMYQWSSQSSVPPVTTRYFLTGSNKKILLEHDEDYCAPIAGATATDAPPPEGCDQMDADAADLDMNAAYYLEQTHHTTNATAWMITGEDQVAFVQVRDSSCRTGPDPLGCRVRLTHEHIGVIVHRPGPGPRPEPHPIRR